MGRLVRLRKGRSPLHAVEGVIAALHEELSLTLNFAQAMVSEGNYHAAAEVVEEQRRRLVRATARIEHALRRPAVERSRARMRAALSGVAAAVVFASGAFAAWGPAPRPPTASASIGAIQEASDALTMATAITDPAALQQLVGDAQDAILEVAKDAPADPKVKRSLLDWVQKQQRVLQRNPHIPGAIRERAREIEETVQLIVVELPSAETSSPETSGTETADPSASTDAEAAAAPPGG